MRTTMALGPNTPTSSRRARLSARLTGSRHSQRENPFDEEFSNPLEDVARWRLHANAIALRSGASFAFALGNRSVPVPPPPGSTIWLDSTLSEWKGKEVIRVDVWDPVSGPETAPQAMLNVDGDDDAGYLSANEDAKDDPFTTTDEPQSKGRRLRRQISKQLVRQFSRQPSRNLSRQTSRNLSRQTSRDAPGLEPPQSDAVAAAVKAWDDAKDRMESSEDLPQPVSRRKRVALINFHGGGFVLGNGTDDARWAGAVMDSFHAVVFSVNYRLAPGYPYPTPVEDCVDAILQIASRADEFGIDPDRIFLSGFSAGGTLALASWVVLQDPSRWDYKLSRPAPAIAGLTLFYPLLDWTIPRDIKRQLCSHPDETLSPAMTNLFDASYLYPPIPRDKRDDPRLSPGLMPDEMLEAIPPVHLCLCERDMLHNEGLKFAERLSGAGREVTARVVKGQKHAWDKPPPFMPPVSASVEYQAAVVAMRHWITGDGAALTRRDVKGVSDATEVAPGIMVTEAVDVPEGVEGDGLKRLEKEAEERQEEAEEEAKEEGQVKTDGLESKARKSEVAEKDGPEKTKEPVKDGKATGPEETKSDGSKDVKEDKPLPEVGEPGLCKADMS
ncbi:Alpha/Beta hydrolase protein [Plectosphaerella cucumerina]|uniref:Alpha/Beta hydrolase protein n=1 Tax=Plectosphaerella cucumerina TaxID=40658 RepID=A0A8K0TD88_9PEZI|nr:Alpha/Beta hydrolase protein [Plectosphaerella cucumerina]